MDGHICDKQQLERARLARVCRVECVCKHALRLGTGKTCAFFVTSNVEKLRVTYLCNSLVKKYKSQNCGLLEKFEKLRVSKKKNLLRL
jgi:hypothetical protein